MDAKHNMKFARILVTGRVQGVFYRGDAKKHARYLNIKGFVQNKPDGSVYIEALGNDEQLTQFIRWCRNGPPHAIVEDISVEYGELRNFKVFEVKY